MSNKIEGPPVLPPWMDATGSIVAQLTKTILAMQEASKGGVNMDPALQDLLMKLSQDANNFIGSLNQFCQAVAQACAATVKQTDPKSEKHKPPCSPCCSCYSSDSEELDCESLEELTEDDEAAHPSVVPKESIDVEKACQVCIIEEEFTETSTYTVDPVTNKVKISKIEEYSQLAKLTSMKHQSVQTCKCPRNESGKAEGDSVVHDLVEIEPVQESISEADEINLDEVADNISKESSEHAEEQRKLFRRVSSSSKPETLLGTITEIPSRSSSAQLQSKCKHSKNCCTCEQELQRKSPTISGELSELTAKSSPKDGHSTSSDQTRPGSKGGRSPSGSVSVQEQSLPTRRGSQEESLQAMRGSQEESFPTKRGSQEESLHTNRGSQEESFRTTRGSQEEFLQTKRGSKEESLQTKRGSKEEYLQTKRGSLEESLQTKRESKEESLQTKRGSKEEYLQTKRGSLEESVQTKRGSLEESLQTKRGSKEEYLQTKRGSKEESLQTKRGSQEDRPSNPQQQATRCVCDEVKKKSPTAFVELNEITSKTSEKERRSTSSDQTKPRSPSNSQRGSKEGRSGSHSYVGSIIEQEESLPTKWESEEGRSDETQSCTSSTCYAFQNSPYKREGKERGACTNSTCSIFNQDSLLSSRGRSSDGGASLSAGPAIEQAPSVQTRRDSKEGRPCTPSTCSLIQQGPSVHTQRDSKEGRPCTPSTCSLIQQGPSVHTQRDSKEGRPCTPSNCSLIQQGPSVHTQRDSKEERPCTPSTCSLIQQEPSLHTQRDSKEGRPCTPSTCSLIQQEPSLHTQRDSKEGRPCTPSTCSLIQQQPSLHTQRDSKEGRPCTPSTGSLIQQEPSVHTQRDNKEGRPCTTCFATDQEPSLRTKRDSKEGRRYIPSTCSVIEHKPSLPAKRRSNEEPCVCVSSSPVSSIIETESVSKHSSNGRRSASLLQPAGEPNILTTQRSSKEERPDPPVATYTVEQEPSVQSKQRGREEGCGYKCCTCSTTQTDPVPSYRDAETKQSSKEPVSRTSTASLTEPHSAAGVAKQQSIEERSASRSSAASLSESYPPAGVTKQQSKEERSASRSSAASLSESYPPAGVAKQKSKEERLVSRTSKPSKASLTEAYCPGAVSQRQSRGPPYSFCCTCSVTEAHPASRYSTDYEAKQKSRQQGPVLPSITELKTKRGSLEERPASPSSTDESELASSAATAHETRRRSKEEAQGTGTTNQTESVLPFDAKRKSSDRPVSPDSTDSAYEPQSTNFESKGKSKGEEPVSPHRTASANEPTFETKRQSKDARNGSRPSTGSITKPERVSSSEIKRKAAQERPVSAYSTDSANESEAASPFETKRRSKDGQPVSPYSTGSTSEIESVLSVGAKRKSKEEKSVSPSSPSSTIAPEAVSPASGFEAKRKIKEEDSVSPSSPSSAMEPKAASASETERKSREETFSSRSPPGSANGPGPASSAETKRKSREETLTSRSPAGSATGPEGVLPSEAKRKSKDERPVSPYGTDSGTETESVSLTHADFEPKRKSKEESAALSFIASEIELEPGAKQRSEEERFITPSVAGAPIESHSVSTSVKTTPEGKEEGPESSGSSGSKPKSPFTDVTTETAAKAAEGPPISIKQLFEKQRRKLSTDQCICTSNELKEWLGTTNSQELQIPPLQDNRINKWVQRLSKTEQTLASIRAKIDNFSTGLPRTENCPTTCAGCAAIEKIAQQSRIRTRQQRSPRPVAAASPPSHDLSCACPDYSDHHHRYPLKGRSTTPVKPGIHERCASPRTASKRRISPVLVKQLPLMPAQAIPIQPGVIDNHHQRPYRPRTSKTRNSKIANCSCDSK